VLVVVASGDDIVLGTHVGSEAELVEPVLLPSVEATPLAEPQPTIKRMVGLFLTKQTYHNRY
jgi:hypothetical protein